MFALPPKADIGATLVMKALFISGISALVAITALILQFKKP
jgi:hypothetical protein